MNTQYFEWHPTDVQRKYEKTICWITKQGVKYLSRISSVNQHPETNTATVIAEVINPAGGSVLGEVSGYVHTKTCPLITSHEKEHEITLNPHSIPARYVIKDKSVFCLSRRPQQSFYWGLNGSCNIFDRINSIPASVSTLASIYCLSSDYTEIQEPVGFSVLINEKFLLRKGTIYLLETPVGFYKDKEMFVTSHAVKKLLTDLELPGWIVHC
jgi:hypothetical protein